MMHTTKGYSILLFLKFNSLFIERVLPGSGTVLSTTTRKAQSTYFLSAPLESWGSASRACLKLDLEHKQHRAETL